MNVKKHKFFAFLGALLLLLTSVFFSFELLYAQDALFPSNVGSSDRFGQSLDISGDTIVVGAPEQSTNPPNLGMAYVFILNNNGKWMEDAVLSDSTLMDGDGFGYAVAIDENTIAVGAPFQLNNRGAVYVFERNAGNWMLVQHIVDNNLMILGQFGSAVDIDGEFMMIGSPEDLNGSVSIYKKISNSWTFQQKIFASDAAVGQDYGFSIAIDNDAAIIGDRRGNSWTGSAYILRRNGSIWAEEAALVASDAAYVDLFGASVAISGNTALVGAPDEDALGYTTGSVYVFDFDGASWTETTKLTNMTIEPYDHFGQSVALVGDTALIGAKGNIGLGGSKDGAAYVFKRIENMWNERSGFNESGVWNVDYDQFGYAVASDDGQRFVVGAPNAHVNGFNSGKALVLKENIDEYCFCSLGPCGNNDPLRGCMNSTGKGAHLTVLGASDPEVMTLVATGLVPGQAVRFLQGNNAINNGDGVYFGDGRRCAGGNLLRLGDGEKTADSNGLAIWGPLAGDPPINIETGVQSGQIKRYQAWYRDPMGGSPCGAGFNLTNGVEIQW